MTPVPFIAMLLFAPNTAVLLLCCGVLLIYVEMNRPGWLLPLAAGLTVALLAIASLLHTGMRPAGLGITAVAVVLQIRGLRRTLSPAWVVLALLCGAVGLAILAKGEQLAVGAGCGLILGAGTWLLTRIAHRARRNKGLD